MKVESVYHVGFTVSDIERSIEFYRDVLGMTLYRRQHGPAPYLCPITGFEGVPLQVPPPKAPDGGGMLELLQYVSHPATATDRATNRPGNGHLCFKVPDIHGACDELRQKGVRLISEPADITARVHKGAYGVHLPDPERFTVELYKPPSPRPA